VNNTLVVFKFERAEISDIIIIYSSRYTDARGFFEEGYKLSAFLKEGIEKSFTQLNHSFSKKGVLRGLHYQKSPYSQGKLVFVFRGKIIDVAVDIRPSSPSFKKWVSVTLSDKMPASLWIPPGFAHGFLAMEDTDIIYFTSAEYNADYESGIRWNDPDVNVTWPVESPILSEKDSNLPFIRELILWGEL
jgi:dTDP-4-dehydrorhamnose 3,5-epimerase